MSTSGLYTGTDTPFDKICNITCILAILAAAIGYFVFGIPLDENWVLLVVTLPVLVMVGALLVFVIWAVVAATFVLIWRAIIKRITKDVIHQMESGQDAQEPDRARHR